MYDLKFKHFEDNTEFEIDLTKRFHLFTYAEYEARGGMLDFVKSFDDLMEVMKFLREASESRDNTICLEEGHVYDAKRKKIHFHFEGTRI